MESRHNFSFTLDWSIDKRISLIQYHEFSNGEYPSDAVDIDYYVRQNLLWSRRQLNCPLLTWQQWMILRGLPPTLVLTAKIDPLCNKAKEFVRKVTKADVPTAYVRSLDARK